LSQPLEDFCDVIQKEIQTIIGRRLPKIETWILSEQNHPLAPDSDLTAAQLTKMPAEEVRGILASAASRISGRGKKFKDTVKGIVIDAGRLAATANAGNGNSNSTEERAAMI